MHCRNKMPLLKLLTTKIVRETVHKAVETVLVVRVDQAAVVAVLPVQVVGATVQTDETGNLCA